MLLETSVVTLVKSLADADASQLWLGKRPVTNSLLVMSMQLQ